ncbi:hypothetical protein SRHO_G00330810 [Serrasalmus rhombeus]
MQTGMNCDDCSPGTAASSTIRVTTKKPLALSPPGRLNSSSRFLTGHNTYTCYWLSTDLRIPEVITSSSSACWPKPHQHE